MGQSGQDCEGDDEPGHSIIDNTHSFYCQSCTCDVISETAHRPVEHLLKLF